MEREKQKRRPIVDGDSMKEEIIKTDVLCAGGGIAGLMAGIRAGELGANVIIAEKGNVLRSGCGGAGNDHFWCYIPEVHGPDITPYVERARTSQQPGQGGTKFVRTWYEKSFDIVTLWDSWGIPMKYEGKWEFAGHGYPGGPALLALKYHGHNQKKVLTEQAIKKGAKIMNRIMIFSLLGDQNGVTGAMGVDTREDRIVVFQAKSVILGTGRVVRLFPSITPTYMANIFAPMNITGDGRTMAYHAGAELVNMDRLVQHCGPKYFSRGGQATWVGVARDPQGKPVGPYVGNPDRRYGDYTLEHDKTLFRQYAESGKGPVYLDCRGISQEDYEYMMLWLRHEGNAATMNHMKEEGIDLRETPIELTTYEVWAQGGIYYDDKARTTVKGLYAAGDEVRGGISCAAVYGWIAGENATGHAKQTEWSDITKYRPAIDERKRLIGELRGRKSGPDWHEVNVALQQIMGDYCGRVKSETMLMAGLSHLGRLKEKAYGTMMAPNQHDLVRSLETLSLLDMGELVFLNSNERKETRGDFIRSDYHDINPHMDKALVTRKAGGKPVIEWREKES